VRTKSKITQRKYATTFDSKLKPKTIYALSTPFGVSGVSIIRISGPSAKKVLEEMTRGGKKGDKRLPLPQARVSTVRSVVVPNYDQKLGESKKTELERGEVIDQGVVLYFEAGKSFTGEDLVELQLHGSISVIRDTLEALSLLSEDMVEAEAGEFTKRAWAHGKLEGDLTRLEALSDLIHAETRSQRQQAFHQLQGHLGELYAGWSKELYTCLAHVEALVDFGHDEKIDFEHIANNVVPKVLRLIQTIEGHLNDNARGQLLRHGVTVALVGPPNAGKSSLLNLLAQGAFSIVSDEAGTTRDVVEAKIDLGGFPLILQDTAGLNPSKQVGKVELEGIARAKSRFNFSSVKLVVIDVNDHNHFNDSSLHQLIRDNPHSTIFILNKVDTKMTHLMGQMADLDPTFINGKPAWIATDPIFDQLPVVHVSCTSGTGLEQLKEEILSAVKLALGQGHSLDVPSLTRQRHRDHLTEALGALYRFRDCPLEHIEILAEELRLAGKSVSRITGKVDVEQILDIVFKDFCIGK
jgi:tRNA modification GTPase